MNYKYRCHSLVYAQWFISLQDYTYIYFLYFYFPVHPIIFDDREQVEEKEETFNNIFKSIRNVTESINVVSLLPLILPILPIELLFFAEAIKSWL
jgi:hypothetical protein